MDRGKLERIWIEYQQNVAMLRCVVPGLLQASFEGRQQHTFVIGQDAAPDYEVHRLVMGPTPGEPNGIPHLLPSHFVGRIVSVHCAGVILLVCNSLAQGLARALDVAEGFRFDVGAKVAAKGRRGARAATVLYAGSNHFRHIDEWADDAPTWGNPKDDDQRRRHTVQERSMQVIADVLGEALPIRTNLCYELVEALFGAGRHYREFEGHLLRIGQDGLAAAGMSAPIVGLTVTETRRASETSELAGETYVRMSGVLRAAD